ncbi:MAG: chorismate mutase [Chloroflexota bacterium]
MKSDQTEPNYSRSLACRGVRGAITASANTIDAILEATRELLKTIMLYNDMKGEDMATIYFSTTADLNATFPAVAARQIGLNDVALLCGHEMEVPGSLPMCVRVMIHWNTTKTQKEVVHVYLREAKKLRPDRKNLPDLKPKQIDPMEAMVKVLENSY